MAPKLRLLGDALLAVGVLGLIIAGVAFTTRLPEPLARVGEYCFYTWWAPFIAGYVLKKIARWRMSSS